jgi:Na+/proline symporter
MANYKKYLPKKKNNAIGWVMTATTVVFLGVATALIILAYQNEVLSWLKTFGMVLLAIGMVTAVYVVHYWLQSKIRNI